MAAPVPLTATPQAAQIVEHEGKTYETIREGGAYILIPPNTQKHVDPQNKAKLGEQPQNVFYNPIQQFNRDLSVLSIKAFGEDWLERRRVKHERAKGKKHNKKARKTQKDQDKQVLAASEELAEDDAGTKLENNGSGAKRKADEIDGEVATDSSAQKRSKAQDGQPIPTEGASIVADTVAESEQTSVPETGATNGNTNGQPSQPTQPRFRILDALSATGLRALRYAKEIPFVSAVVANDLNPSAIQSMELNVQHNQLQDLITPNLGDAIGHMYQVAYPPTGSHGPRHVNQRYDVIDLDPYGTAAPFIDAALQSINDDGLLCVTCTDSGVFASTGYCEKTYALYGGMPVKGSHMHEAGLRLIINSVATTAAKYGLAIEPLLSLSIDFYARVFIRVRKSPADVKFLAGRTMLVYGCDAGCGAWTTNTLGRNSKQVGKNDTTWYKHSIAQAPTTDRLCEHCGSKTHIAGPMWGGPIHNAAFIEKVLHDLEDADPKIYETIPRIEGMLTTALSELEVNPTVTKYIPDAQRTSGEDMIPRLPPDTIDAHPFFLSLSAISKVIHCIAPGDAAVKGALRHMGYVCTRSHCQPGSIKTDAPWSAIWEVMREWTRQKHPLKEGAVKETTAGWKIMQKARKEGEEESEDRVKVVFDEVLGRDKPSGRKLVRYQQNPRENWGPMTKHKGTA